MKLTNLARKNSIEPGRIAYNAAMYIAIEPHDKKEVLVCRPHAKFLNDEEFMNIFRRQDKTTERYTNPYCLKYLQYNEDEKGPYWLMSPGRFTSLAQLVVDKSSIRVNEKWVDGAIDELLTITEYLHKQKHYALELTPHSILVTKHGSNSITLMPPLSDFIPLKNVLYTTYDERIAPELFNNDEPNQKADIYGIGRIIEFLHPYPTLPYKYKEITKNAVSEDLGQRPQNIAEMHDVIRDRKKKSHITSISISVAAVLAFVALLLFVPWGEDNQHDIKNISGQDTIIFDDGVLMGVQASADPIVNTNIGTASEAERARMNDERMPDTLDSDVTLTPEMKEKQRKMTALAAQKFRQKFKQKARSVLKKVYTKENLESKEKFMNASQEANLKIVDILTELTTQHQIEASTANRIAAEVYDEVAEELKKQQ